MPRLHLLEIHDQAWCPASLRDALTDNLQFYLDLGNSYAPIAARLRAAVGRSGARRIVDLCSGAGGPWRRLAPTLAVPVLLTDKFPNRAGLARLRAATAARVDYYPGSVDATRVAPELDGFRTVFTAFHHFAPDRARAILEDAVRRRQGIGVFEVTARRPGALLALLLAPLLVLLSAPFIRPFRWSRLGWTYTLVLPIVAAFDGLVSCLRTYDVEELRRLTHDLTGDGYTWDIGRAPSRLSPAPVTYLIGLPGPPPGALEPV